MLKKIIIILKKLIMSVMFIYAYNKLALPLDVVIPMNMITILLVTICGVPAIIMFVLFSLVFI